MRITEKICRKFMLNYALPHFPFYFLGILGWHTLGQKLCSFSPHLEDAHKITTISTLYFLCDYTHTHAQMVASF